MSSELLCVSNLWVIVIFELLLFTRISLSLILLIRGSGLIKKCGPFNIKVTLNLSESIPRVECHQLIRLMSTDMGFHFLQPLV